MRKHTITLLVVALALLLAAPGLLAQEPSPTDLAQNYYTALGQAAASGDLTALLDLFADDATITVPALSPDPVSGKEAIQTTIGGILAMLPNLQVTVGDIAVEGDQVTVDYTLMAESLSGELPATDTFVIQDGKIQSLTIDITPEALVGAGVVQPAHLPETGGPMAPLLPGLLLLGGAALVGLSRRLPR